MKNPAKIICFLFVLLGEIKAQDLIVKKDSTEIYCKIVYVNVKSLYYTISNDPNEIKIDKSDVLRFVFDWNQKKTPTATPTPVVVQNTVSSGEFIKLLISGAVAIPTGNFGSSDVNNNQSGLALTGWMVNAGLGLKINKNIRVLGTYFYQDNPFDASSLDAGLAIAYPGPKFTSTAGHWLVNGVFGGLHVNLPIEDSKKTAVFIQYQMGFPKFTCPPIDTRIVYMGSILSTSIGSAEAKSFAYFMGLGASFKMAEEVSFQVSANLFGARPTFVDVVSKNSSGSSTKDTFSQKINSVNISIGLLIKLD